MRPTVTVTIVTCNSQRYIRECLQALLAQTYPLEVLVVDNASLDGTCLVLSEFASRIRIVCNDRNSGFSAAQNQAISLSGSDWVLTLNPDVLLHPEFVARLMDAASHDPKVGTVCGKLLRIGPGFVPLERPLLDSTGIYFARNLRHFDRGWGEPDDGRYSRMEYVFGASAAAALYRREMIADISQTDGFFDPDFFAYREDADVAWRAQLLGWRCLYVPDATGHHVRRVQPGPRRGVPAFLNMHSVKNRFLMRIKNATPSLYGRHWMPITVRDLFIVGGCLLTEQSSLPAFWRVLRLFKKTWDKRHQIQARRRVSEEYVDQWFSDEPTAIEAPEYTLSHGYRATSA